MSSSLRRRMKSQMEAQDVQEKAEQLQVQKSQNSSFGILMNLYLGVIFASLIIGGFYFYYRNPALYVHLVSYFRAPDHIRFIGLFPDGISPRKDLPPVLLGKYAICTPANLVTRRALNYTRHQQIKLSSNRQKIFWHVQELPDNQVLLSYLWRRDCVENDTIIESPQQLRRLYLWCQLSTLRKPTGMIQYGLIATSNLPLLWDRNLVVVCEGSNNRVSTALIILQDPAPIASQVLSWMKEQATTSSEDGMVLTLEEFLYDLLQDKMMNTEWIVGRLEPDSVVPPATHMILAKYDDNIIVLPRKNPKPFRQDGLRH